MKSTSNSKTNMKDIALFGAVFLLTAIAFGCSYYAKFSQPIKVLVWVIWLVLALLISSLTAKGKQAIEFAKEAKVELQKVVWPTRQETIQTTAIVMVMVVITGFALWGVDSITVWVIAKLTNLGG